VSLDRGGVERFVCDLALEQQRKGVDITIFTIYRRGTLAGRLEDHGIRVVSGEKRAGLDVRAIYALRRLIRSGRYDVVHTHNFVPNYYSCMAVLFMQGAPPIINTCHDMGTRLSKTQLRLLYRASVIRTSAVAMVSHGVADRFIESRWVDPARVTVIHNGISVERFISSSSQRARARSRLGIAENAFLIGSLGRLVAEKNHGLLLETLASIRTSLPNAFLCLVGGGPKDAELRRLARDLGIADRVIFTGEIEDVAAVLPAFDVMAMSSNTEGYSVALLEAAAAGLPTVATRVGGNTEIVQDAVSGILVPPRDKHAFAMALMRLAEDPQLRTRMGKAAREWALSYSSISSTADAYAALYSKHSTARRS
jgi:glycosyltransferase involved in cell wall biosynthesis